jgi:hypothetical protein
MRQRPNLQAEKLTKTLGATAPTEQSFEAHNKQVPEMIAHDNPSTYVSDEDDPEETKGHFGVCLQCSHLGWMTTLCPVCNDRGMLHAGRSVTRKRENVKQGWGAQLQASILQLTRVKKAGNELPDVGQCCLIIKGTERQDVGQEAVVTKQTKAMIRVTYLDKSGRQASKMKHPGLLILLGDGVHVVQDDDGFVWVR